MFRKRFISLAVVLTLFVSTTANVNAATPIGQDSSQGYPINSGMETSAEISAVNTQVSAQSGSAVLSQDRKAGKYGLEVNTGGTGNVYSQFTVVNSATFNATAFGEIHLYVKPKAGAEWMKFYVVSGGSNVLLKSDSTGDGTFDVGKDLIAGVWNEVSIQMIDSDVVLSSVGNLVVQTNTSSVWGFDDIKSRATNVFTYDINSFDNSQTVMNSGKLQFNTSGSAIFDTTPTLLFSGLKNLEFFDDTLADFELGSYNGCEVVNGAYIGKDISSNGTVISNGGTAPASAFDNNINTSWYSPHTQEAMKGIDYIGYTFTTAKSINGAHILQGEGYESISAMKLQYFDGIAWVDAQSVTHTGKPGELQEYLTNGSVSSTKWRFLADVNTPDAWEKWKVKEIYFSDTASTSTYTSSAKVLTDLNNVKNISCSWNETKTNEVNVEVSLSTNGTTWSEWEPALNGEPIGAFRSAVLTAGAQLKYRVKFDSLSMIKDIKVNVEGDKISNNQPLGKLSGVQVVRSHYDRSGAEIDTAGADKYLLSFDNMNSWYSCKNGNWELIRSGIAPTQTQAKEFGMTLEEINALGKKEFAKLYTNGKDIYSVDVCIYYASPNSGITPSISRIAVLTDVGKDAYQTGQTYSPIYASKSKAFDGSDWRSVNKIYPVEVSPKSAEVYYFALVGGVYKSMQGSTWSTVGTIPENADTNWIEITQKGVTGTELRQIKQDVLTSNLLTGNLTGAFSIVSCVKAYDETTTSYKSEMYVDYTEDMFDSANLTLNVTYTNGTTKQYAGLTDTQVEDFMKWIQGRQYNKGQIFFLIKSGNTNDFINYYMIQNVSVVEL